MSERKNSNCTMAHAAASRFLCIVLVSLVTNDVRCQAYLSPPELVGYLSWRERSSILRASSDETHHASFPYVGEGALRSRGLARNIRKNRANRGRIKTSQSEVKKRRIPKNSDPRASKKCTTKTNGLDLPYESAIETLRAYHSNHSNLVIPRRFIVPKEDVYPTEWHGIDLCSTVYNMKWWQRHVKQNPDRVAELNKLGFIWERLQPEWNLVLEALITYSALNGDLLVPTKFVVPHESEHYPKATWGLPLGNCVFRIRSRHDFLRGKNAESRRAQLDGLGFVWDMTEHLFRKFYFVLRHFKKLEEERPQEGTGGARRALRVPSTFIVPSGEDSGWPPELWGYRLGEKCNAVRQKELYIKNDVERQRALAELGFQWSGNATLGWLDVVHGAAIYSRMNGRNLDVPSNFVVPAPPHIDHDSNDAEDTSITGSDDAWPWPGEDDLCSILSNVPHPLLNYIRHLERLWGLNLGQRLKDIRLKGAYLHGSSGPARRAQLDALGFNWTPKRGRKTKVVKLKKARNATAERMDSCK